MTSFFKKQTSFPFQLDLTPELSRLAKEGTITLVNTGNHTARGFLLEEFLRQSDHVRQVFWIAPSHDFEELSHVLGFFFGSALVRIPANIDLPTWYHLLARLDDPTSAIFLFEDYHAAQDIPLPTPEEIVRQSVHLKKEDTVQIYDLFETLSRRGYTTATDTILEPGQFLRQGENLYIFPFGSTTCFRVELFGSSIERIAPYDQAAKTAGEEQEDLIIRPGSVPDGTGNISLLMEACKDALVIEDDLEVLPHIPKSLPTIRLTTFPGENETFTHINFFSVLPFYTITDFVLEVKERFRRDFSVVVMTKKPDEVEHIFKEHDIMFSYDAGHNTPSTVTILTAGTDDFVPHSFQNNERGMLFLTDREIFQFHRTSRRRKAIRGMNLEMMNSLKTGDFVVHLDHGVAKFEGIIRREDTHEGHREYLKLCYAGNDKLFVPVESAEKVSKFVGEDEPRLMRLGSAEWQNTQKKVKKETERIAKDLLKLYARREMAKGSAFAGGDDMMADFCDAFAYDLTPGQAQAWEDVRIDMERPRPMDRLVCGDVGFGKTEVAMRAAFKAFASGYQAAFLSPITILAEQHYQTFLKRVAGKNYGVRIELLSRFQSAAEQKKILKDIESGLVDIIIGTHRLLSDDIKFQKLGLLIVDEEQRFGVQQKEKLKNLRAGVDVLTMTATPIPRTLNMSLNKLKDITTITTPPPGRLPVATEVRKYNLNLIRERILMETQRGGQVYFLHNKVQTIEAQAQQLRHLVPEARFIVAHGQLSPLELEDRIRTFKNGEADILIASTIIENGIDLPNANTLLVNGAERFGLSQLYQLRGRVGRGRTQAYAFFLYHGQKLDAEARKRLRAIVEASELGSGFQIAMRDLEIRGAGEVLGISQSGAMKDVGVSHFIRMLNKTVEEMKSGEVSEDIEEEENITVEIPLSAFLPSGYIPSNDEKIQVYQELGSIDSLESLEDVRNDLKEDYGQPPAEVENLFRVIRLKILLRQANLAGVRVHRLSHRSHEIVLRMGKNFSPDQILTLLRHSDKKWVITANALKLKVEHLSLQWYDQLCADVKYLSTGEIEVEGRDEKETAT